MSARRLLSWAARNRPRGGEATLKIRTLVIDGAKSRIQEC